MTADPTHRLTPFRVHVTDPPWKFGDSLPGKSRGASKNYACMSLQQLIDFPLPEMAEDSVLFMWRVSSMQDDACDLMASWGFRLHSEIVWEKLTKTGKDHFGMGRIVRGAHETCLIGVRGKATRFVKAKNVRSRFAAPVGRHSEKPDAFYEIVESLFPGPYVETFARRRRAGWTQFGDQLPAEVAA